MAKKKQTSAASPGTEGEAKARGRGRPTAYKKEYANLARNYCLLGATDPDLAQFFDVSEATISNWKHSQPDFLEAIKEGKEDADANVAKSLYHRALGYSHKDTKFASHEGQITDRVEFIKHYAPDPTACIFWLKNRQKDKWRDKNETEHSGKVQTTTIIRGDDADL